MFLRDVALGNHGNLSFLIDIEDIAFFVVTPAGNGFTRDGLDIVEIETKIDRKNAYCIIRKRIIRLHDVEGALPRRLVFRIHFDVLIQRQ